ncbi:hypothetical protein [Algibacter sp.]|uniref:hypothetical protein n=1 Tax=Algibacter sp. TaxID=1872428 RepID=UPI003C759B30
MKNKKLHIIESSGFKTPNDYFESLDDKILSKIKIESPLNPIKETGFKVPDNYFESLNESILGKNITNKEPKVIQFLSKRNLVYLSGIAAAILLLFNLSLFENTPTFSNLDIETVESYINEEDFSSYEIAALYGDEQIEEYLIIEHSFNDDNLEGYLMDNTNIEELMMD